MRVRAILQMNEGVQEYPSIPVSLSPGKNHIQLDYADTLEQAELQLWWQGPGVFKQVVQTKDLHPSMPPGQLLVNDSGDRVKVGRSRRRN